jgi:hypothetical protein
MIPCCVGNQWYYSQEKCPASIDYVIKREIIAQNGEEYLLSGWNFAGENLSANNALLSALQRICQTSRHKTGRDI